VGTVRSARGRLLTRTAPELVAGLAGLVIAVRDGRTPSLVVWALIWAVAEGFSERRRLRGRRREGEDVVVDLVLPLVLPAALLVAALTGATAWAVLLGGLCLGGAAARLLVAARA
jgi:hypothetical protein